MTTHKTLLFACFALTVGASFAQAQTKAELVDRYMAITDIEASAAVYVDGYFNELERMYAHDETDLLAHEDFKQAKAQYHADLMAGWRVVYLNHLSTEELVELIEFLDSPTGQKFLKLSDRLQPHLTDHSTQVAAKLNDQIMALLQKHQPQ